MYIKCLFGKPVENVRDFCLERLTSERLHTIIINSHLNFHSKHLIQYKRIIHLFILCLYILNNGHLCCWVMELLVYECNNGLPIRIKLVSSNQYY